VEEIVPTDKFPPRIPDTSQFADVLVVPETAALNCCDWPACKLAFMGEMETETVAGVIETIALADAVGCATLCAVTLTGLDGTDAGAVYVPDEEIVPTVEFPPRVPFASQFTAVLLVPEIVAVNCWDWPTCKLVLAGEMETDTAGTGVIEIVALADEVDCAVLCAVTVTAAASPHSGPEMLQPRRRTCTAEVQS
jgi:hypothetical protein